MNRKKIIIISLLILLAAFFAGLLYIFLIPKTAGTATNPEADPAPANLRSFRGVLADVLNNAEKKAEDIKNEIIEAIPNPFSGERNDTANENNFSFAVLGDTQYFNINNPRGNFQKAAAQISKNNPDLVIATGDLVSNCEGKSSDTKDYANWKKVLGTLAGKTYAVQGNHDRVSNASKCDQIWADAFNFPANGPSGFSEFVYSLDIKNSHFVFLDSNKPDAHQINATQRDWLEQDLSINKKENIFVVFHEPAYPMSDKAKESLDAEPEQRNALWEIFEKHNVTAVFNGHEHIVSRRKIGSVYQFVFGSTDSFNHKLPARGVAEYSNQGQGRFGLVRVNGKEITIETRGPDGTLLNTFTFSK